MKQWIRIGQKLVNLTIYKEIAEPFYVTAVPSYWSITAYQTVGTVETWTFTTESECKATYNEIERILTSNSKFL